MASKNNYFPTFVTSNVSKMERSTVLGNGESRGAQLVILSKAFKCI